MSPEERRAALVEKVADLVRFNHDPIAIADEAIDLISAEVMEEAARVADAEESKNPFSEFDDGWNGACESIAAAIRALKDKS